jgi:predicted phage gp36 major capsid-like protein
MALSAYIPMTILFCMDKWSANKVPLLGDFSTGYLIVAVRE